MRPTSLAALALALVLAAPSARAEPSIILQALDHLPATPAFYGDPVYFDVVNLVALQPVVGLSPEVRLADLESLDPTVKDRLFDGLSRLTSNAGFLAFLVKGGPQWMKTAGFDLLDADWFVEAGKPPARLLVFGGAHLPAAEALGALAAQEYVAQDVGGESIWVRGKDYALSLPDRNVELPFWGELGMSGRIWRSDDAIVGGRGWPEARLALAVQTGAMESLAEQPAYRLAVAASEDPAHFSGGLLQMSFVAGAPGSWADAPPPAETVAPVPPFELLSFADRQEADGPRLVLTLAYRTEAEAALAVERLPARIAAGRSLRNDVPLPELFQAEVSAHLFQSEDGAAAVLVLTPSPESLAGANGTRDQPGRLYRLLTQMLMTRDLGFLAPG